VSAVPAPDRPLWRRRGWLVVGGVVVVGAVIGTVVAARSDPAPREPRFRPPAGTAYLGVSTDTARLPAFAAASGRARPALYGRWTTPGGSVQPVLDDAARGGFTPLIHWNLPMDGQQITAGRQDDYLEAQASAIRAYGRPVFVRLDWEFNTGANPRWSPPAVPPEQYVASWRHVADILADVDNLALVWCPGTWPSSDGRRVADWWPGDDVVDWVGLDAYPQSAAKDYLLDGPDGMNQIRAFAGAHGKPLMLAEWAPNRPHPDTAEPVDLVFDWAEAHPDVQALVYFDFVVGGKDYRLSAHPVGAATYRRRTADTDRYLDRVD
jgi:hypothetical protein